MITDHSFGIIPLRKGIHGWEVLLILHRGGRHWSFPKGHAEKNETAKETACREFTEETGLSVTSFLSDEQLVESYEFFARGQRVFKTVHYYLALADGTIKLQPQEITDSKWVLLNEAEKHVTFQQARALCQKTCAFLDTYNG